MSRERIDVKRTAQILSDEIHEIQKEFDAYLKRWWITNIFASVFRRTK
jgi:hypothetical protein